MQSANLTLRRKTSEAFAEESEEQGSGCSFHPLRVETESSGLCEIAFPSPLRRKPAKRLRRKEQKLPPQIRTAPTGTVRFVLPLSFLRRQTSEAFAEESEEQGSGCSFHPLRVETESSGLCDELSREAKSYPVHSARGSADGTRSDQPARRCWRRHGSSPDPDRRPAWQ